MSTTYSPAAHCTTTTTLFYSPVVLVLICYPPLKKKEAKTTNPLVISFLWRRRRPNPSNWRPNVPPSLISKTWNWSRYWFLSRNFKLLEKILKPFNQIPDNQRTPGGATSECPIWTRYLPICWTRWLRDQFQVMKSLLNYIVVGAAALLPPPPPPPAHCLLHHDAVEASQSSSPNPWRRHKAASRAPPSPTHQLHQLSRSLPLSLARRSFTVP